MLPLEYHYHYFSALTHTKLKPYQPFSRANSRVSLPPLDDTLRRFRFPNSPNDSLRYGLWGHHRSSWACRSAGEPDSAADSGEEKTGDDDAGSNRGKGGWWSRWRRWRWQPLIQVQEIGILLLQIGIGFFVMRLLRPGIPLPGSDPKAATVFVSVPYSEFLSRINSDQVQKVEVDGVHIMFKLKADVGTSHDGGGDVVAGNGGGGSSSITRLQESESLVKSVAPTKRIVYTTTRPSDIRTPYEKMLDNKVEFGSPDKRSGGFFNSALIALFYAAVLAGLLHRVPVSFSQHTAGQIRNRKSGTSAGKKSSEQGEIVTFADIAGVDEAKEELEEIVEFLRNPDRYVRLGARPPRGVLLVGLPGTGKTLLAKAVAGEADVPFISCSASEFVELYVGMGASRVRDLFARAKREAPAIIFIDEIDAIGSKRGGPDIGGGGAEREQGLLQILTEMDGFKVSTAQVLVIGATNRLDILDPALLRKGRFDKIIRVGLPSEDGRYAILKVHARNKFFRSEEEKHTLLKEISEQTEDFTGAELQNILNEAGILTARKDLDYIGRDELLEALKRQKGTFETGQEDSTDIPEELKLRLAYREAAVAVLACYFPEPHRPFVETDISSIRSQPNMRYTEISGQVFARKSDYINSIVRACAPRVIEEEMFGIDNMCWISAKATLEASRRAEFLILQTGMTAFGKAYYKNYSDLVPNLAMKLEALRDEYMRYATEKCSSVLQEYHLAVETITDILLEKGKIQAEEIWDIYKSAPRVAQPPVSPVDEYGALIYAGRWGIHGISLPGRVTFAPGNVGFSTFGAPRPTETQMVSDETWKLVDDIWDKKVQNIKDEATKVIEEEKEKPQLLMASHFL